MRDSNQWNKLLKVASMPYKGLTAVELGIGDDACEIAASICKTIPSLAHATVNFNTVLDRAAEVAAKSRSLLRQGSGVCQPGSSRGGDPGSTGNQGFYGI